MKGVQLLNMGVILTPLEKKMSAYYHCVSCTDSRESTVFWCTRDRPHPDWMGLFREPCWCPDCELWCWLNSELPRPKRHYWCGVAKAVVRGAKHDKLSCDSRLITATAISMLGGKRFIEMCIIFHRLPTLVIIEICDFVMDFHEVMDPSYYYKWKFTRAIKEIVVRKFK